MNRYKTIESMKSYIDGARAEGKKVGFVPTMGALHQGHASLIAIARESCEEVVVSVFVNPTQFNSKEDFETYPLTLQDDLNLARQAGATVVFTPTVEALYGNSLVVKPVDYGQLTSVYEGQNRKGHFNGVVAVVRKLFSAVNPHRVFFGEKDLQQLAVIRRLAQEEFADLEVIGCPLVRESDGLAMSSRNVRLSGLRRQDALALYDWLNQIKNAARGTTDVSALLAAIEAEAKSMAHVELEYIDVVNAKTFDSLRKTFNSEDAFAIVAAQVGGVRLIDNCRLACS